MNPNDTLWYLMIPPKNILFLEQLFHQQFVLKLNVKKVVNNIFCKILDNYENSVLKVVLIS